MGRPDGICQDAPLDPPHKGYIVGPHYPSLLVRPVAVSHLNPSFNTEPRLCEVRRNEEITIAHDTAQLGANPIPKPNVAYVTRHVPRPTSPHTTS